MSIRQKPFERPFELNIHEAREGVKLFLRKTPSGPPEALFGSTGTVSGWTMTRAERQLDQIRDRIAHKMLSQCAGRRCRPREFEAPRPGRHVIDRARSS
jgi:hypothetical protein